MSWKDNILQDFIIKTGDGVDYTVFWKKASKTASWNNAIFSYIGIRGQNAKKQEALARHIQMEFYFQGPDHLVDSQRFENSLNDKNPCLVKHPLYGNITCQFFSVTFSNDENEQNTTKITTTAIETITEGGLIVPNPNQVIQLAQRQINTNAPAEITNLPVTVRDANDIKSTMEASKSDGLKIVTLSDQAKEYTNAYNTAISNLNYFTSIPVVAMAQVCNFVSIPGQFNSLVIDRFTFLETQYARMVAIVTGKAIRPAQKKIYEIQAASCVSAMCVAAITPSNALEYTTSKSVLQIMQRLQNNYNSFVTTLDGLEISSGGINEYYIYSADTISLLADCVNTTLANLMVIALAGKQERFINIPEDSNAHLLSYRYYGGSIDDANLNYFVSTNNLTIPQMLQIKKGTKIVYYA